MKTSLIIVLAAFFSVGLYISAQNSPPILTDEEILVLLERDANNEFRHRISGSIVSSDNNASLTGVTVEFDEARSLSGGERRKTEQVLQSNTFIFTSEPCQLITIHFNKTGYYSERISSSTLNDYLDGKAVMTADEIIITPPVTIVMEPIGELMPANQVLRAEIPLVMFKNGSNVDIKYFKYPFEGKEEYEYKRRNYFPNEAALPENIIYGWPIYDNAGNLTSFQLKTTIPNSGFKFDWNLKTLKDYERRMNLAPESGYEAIVTILPEHFGKTHYLYMKLDGMYGKAEIYIDREGERAQIKAFFNRGTDSNPRNVNI